jgi:hypothetical protein
MARTRGADQVVRNIRAWAQDYHDSSVRVVQNGARTVEQRMKQEHRWQNRTGRAEKNLRARVEVEGGVIRLIAEHGVPYGEHLETMQEGRFAILQPTVRSEWPRILAALRRVGRRGGGR